jgi:hypothetical protein
MILDNEKVWKIIFYSFSRVYRENLWITVAEGIKIEGGICMM